MKSRFFIFVMLSLLAMPTMAQDAKKVACIGNSVTYGYGHANPSETSYPVCLGRLLGDGYEVHNFGHSGATLLNKGHRPYTKQEVYTKALDLKPDVAVIHLGLNDTDPRNWPNYRDEFIPDYMALIDTLRTVNADVKIWICRMTPIFDRHRRFKSGTRDWFWQIQEAIETVAKLSNVGLIDLHEPLYDRPDLFADALHPDAEGAQIIANTVYSAITGDYGGLSLPSIYSSGMVVQRDAPFVLQGKANAGDVVKARIAKQKQSAVANENGDWRMEFAPLAMGKEHTLNVECGSEKIVLEDIVAGEVWLCSGQSNMAWLLKNSIGADEAASTIAEKNIRVYDMKPRVYTDNINWDSIDLVALNRHEYTLPTSWQRLDVASAKEFSAIACHFAAVLSDSLNVPIGLICNAVGGAPIESFIDRKTMEHHPVLVDILDNWTQNDFVQEWVRGRAMYNIKNSKNKLQRHPYEPCYLFETSVAPIAGYPLKGVIWYQGESNAHNVELFAVQFPAFVDSWRKAWDNPHLPFYVVQLSGINRPSWPHFRDVQRRLSYTEPNSYIAVSSDKGDEYDVHPRDKKPIGERLARQALYHSYGKNNITPSGPMIHKAECRDGALLLYFEYGRGLRSSDGGPLLTFEVADESGLFHAADEVTVGDGTILISSKKVENPVKARYGWQPYTRANLVNSEGLPASTFQITVGEVFTIK